ncbi:Transmembrane protein [Phytophthora palmivora]|uniref:Transmembrane protein n=1 Tax=Phytophthora palmivora TaxID=4796 RepID=A0A2P4YU71_9STRA|nr:Transmembrane protein [Phytophthora palmivora]
MFFSQTLLAWEGLSYLENNSLAQFQDEIASWRAMEDSNVDSITKTEFQIAASAMLQKTLDEQSLRLGLNFNTNAVSFNASHVKLSSDIGFDAVTIEIPFDEHAIADNRSTTAAMTPASTSVTSSNSSILYKLRSITACGETACLIPPPGNSFAATATLGDTAYTQWNVESQIQAFAACIFEDGSEYLTTDYLHGSSCTRRSTTSFLVYSFGRRVVADDVTVEVSSSNNLLMVTNMQRYHTITLGRLSWHTKDLASDFNAACGLVESFDSLGDFDGLYSQWTPLAMVTTPTDMQGDLLFQRNVLKNTWDLDGLCSTSVDVFATQVEENHWYMSYGLQESYTAALFLLFQNAVVRHEKQSADGSRTLNFAGSSTHVTLEARIPLPSALISIIGSAIVLAAALGIVIAGRRKQCAIQSDVGVEEIAKVLLVDHRFPRLVLDCTLDDPGARTQQVLQSGIPADSNDIDVDMSGGDADNDLSLENATTSIEPIEPNEPLIDIIEIPSSCSDEDSDDDLPCQPRRRLRPYRLMEDEGGDTEMEGTVPTVHEPQSLALPDPPLYHPVTKERNIACAGEEYDLTVEWDVWALLDRTNKGLPNEAYLINGEMKRIDTWKDKFSNLTYSEFSHKFPSTYTVSKDVKCFFKAIRITCHVIQDPDLVPLQLIAEFEKMLDQEAGVEDTKEGVKNADIKKFLAFLRMKKAPVACNVFAKNKLTSSINTVQALNDYPLDPGVYVVGASCPKRMRHCFVLRIYEDKPREVFDRWYEGGEDHEYYTEPLTNLKWIRRYQFIRAFARVGKVPQKKPTCKKLKNNNKLA